MSVAVSTSPVRIATAGGTTTRRPTTRSRWSRAGFNLIAVGVFLCSVFPVYWMVTTAFKPGNDILRFHPKLIPDPWTLQNFSDAIHRPYFWDDVRKLYADARDSARVMALVVHPYIMGAPHRLRYLREALDHIAARPGVLFQTGEEILDWYRDARTG